MLDDLDQRIIQELQRNGRRSNMDLAKMFGVAESTIRKRIKDLLDKDIIRIAAVPNPHKLGYGFISIMGLQVRMADLRQVAEMLAQKPNICYLSFVTGRYDLLAMVICRSPEELSKFMQEHISAIPSVLRTETFVNLEIIKSPWTDTMDIVELLSDPEAVD